MYLGLDGVGKATVGWNAYSVVSPQSDPLFGSATWNSWQTKMAGASARPFLFQIRSAG
jgi:hypothetical protein